MATGTNISIQQVRTALYNMLVSVSTIATDIREILFQGSGYVYPCVRYETVCDPDECGNYDVNFTVYSWSEDPSSLVVVRIIDEIIAAIHDGNYNDAIKLQNIKLVSASAAIRDDKLWRKEAFFTCLATV